MGRPRRRPAKRLKHDPLTGLLRRDAYTARARRILARHGDTAAVVMDHFKAVNDTLGHAAGDAVLATATHATTPSINGRRAGRSGAGVRGETYPVTTAAHTTEEASE